VQKGITQGCATAEQSGKAAAGTAVCQSDSFRETPTTQDLLKKGGHRGFSDKTFEIIERDPDIPCTSSWSVN